MTATMSWGQEAELLREAPERAEKLLRPFGEQDQADWMLTDEEIEGYFSKFKTERVLMTGSRDWTDERAIRGALKRALKYLSIEPKDATLIHGAAKGADSLSAKLAKNMGMRIEPHPADWNTHNSNCPKKDPGNGGCWQGKSSCKRAGFRRNREMIDSGAGVLIAFVRNHSRGATGTLNIWLQDDRPAIICRQEGDGPVEAEFLNMDRWGD